MTCLIVILVLETALLNSADGFIKFGPTESRDRYTASFSTGSVGGVEDNKPSQERAGEGILQNIEVENINLPNDVRLTSANYDYYHHSSSCQLVHIVHLLSHEGCQPKAIASFACSGSCPSYVQLSTSKFWQHERSCSCCQQTGLQEATFTLDCPALDPPYKKVKTYSPIDCMCRACTDLGRESLKPQELVEALAGDDANG